MLRHWKIMACNALELAVCFGAGPVCAGNCFNPTGNEADIIYSYDHHVCSPATATSSPRKNGAFFNQHPSRRPFGPPQGEGSY
jgi:hypothetical protein